MATSTVHLPESLRAAGSPEFAEVFRAEAERLSPEILQLRRGLALCSQVAEEPFRVLVLDVAEGDKTLCVKTGVFFSGIIGGCSCADDPTPNDTRPEYCELLFEIDRASAATTVTLLPD